MDLHPKPNPFGNMAQSPNHWISRSYHGSSVDLPDELERYIFKLTAAMYPSTASKLCRISKYVQQWVEAVIYETVVLSFTLEITFNLFLRTFDSRPSTFFSKNVKRLYLTNILSSVQVARIISACSGITELTCWSDSTYDLIQFLVPQRLQKLSIRLEALWGISLPFIPTHKFAPDLFSNLSHLHIVKPPSFLESNPIPIYWDNLGLCELPALTHLAFGNVWKGRHSHLLRFLPRLLRHCQRLLALVVIPRARDEGLVKDLTFSGEYSDSRFLILSEFNWPNTEIEYWDDVKHGGPDFWSAVDDLILARKDITMRPNFTDCTSTR